MADPTGSSEVELHLDRCTTCRELVAELAKTSLVSEGSDVVTGDGEPVPIGEHLPPRTPVGRYVLGERLGTGGMSVVYEAADPVLERQVAIKVLRVVLADQAMDRLIAEARAMAKVSHPNVRDIYDIGEVDGRIFLAMELVRGQTLESWLEQQPRGADEIVRVFAAAGAGLAAAHAIGIAHRDFKPSNVLLSDDGRVLVSDFGLARSAQAQTEDGGGTPRYMAPEQRHGRGDARVDQYAFATVLEEALGGRTVPRRLRRAITVALESSPELRHPTMAPLLAALEPARASRRYVGLAGLALVGGTAVLVPWTTHPPATAPVESTADLGNSLDLEVYELDTEARSAYREGDYAESERLAERALARATDIGNEPGRAIALLALGRARARLDRAGQADADTEKAYLVALAAGREDIAAEAASSRLSLLANVLGRPDDALVWGRHAQASLERFPFLSPEWARFESSLGSALAAAGEWHEAIARTSEAIDYARASTGVDDRDERWLLSVALGNRCWYTLRAGDQDAALADCREALNGIVEQFGPGTTETARLRVNLGMVHKERGEYWDAIEQFSRALTTLEAEQGPDNATVGIALINLGAVWQDTGESTRALTTLRRASEVLGPEHPDRRHALHNIAVALRDLGQCEQALGSAQQAIDLIASGLGPDHPALSDPLRLQAECALELGDDQRALRAATQAAGVVDAQDTEAVAEIDDLIARAQKDLSPGPER